MRTALFHLGLAALFTHELDAVEHSEWRLLYVLRSLPDESAYTAFVALHLPLFAVLLWLCHHPRERLRSAVRQAVAGFLVIHAGLHLRLSGAPEYEFEGPLSNLLIYSAAAFGAAFLAATLAGRWREGRDAS